MIRDPSTTAQIHNVRWYNGAAKQELSGSATNSAALKDR